MHRDQGGAELKLGDIVLVPCRVAALKPHGPNEYGGDLTVQALTVHEQDVRVSFGINCRQVSKRREPPTETPAEPPTERRPE